MDEQDIQLLTMEAEKFLETLTLNAQEENNDDLQSELELAHNSAELAESTQGFKETISVIFKQFPDILEKSPLEELKDKSFTGTLADRMGMIYYYLLKMIEFFALNGDVIKTELANNRDVIALAMKLEEKLLVSFKDSLLKIIYLLLDEQTGITDKFFAGKNLTLSVASTLMIINYKGNEQAKKVALGRTLVLADYIKTIQTKNLSELLNLFSTIIEEKGDKFVVQVGDIFSRDVIKQPEDIIKFLEKALSTQEIRENIATSLYSYARKLITAEVEGAK